jgi:oxygen-independent coproporphyrinogen-3 oxidase
MAETLYLGLRIRDGVADEEFRRRFGCGVAEAFPQAMAELRPWLALAEGRWRMTVDGWLLYDRLIQAFL